MADPRVPTSSLPGDVVERTVSPYRHDNHGDYAGCVWFKVAVCIVDGMVIAKREYDDKDGLIRETPLDAQGRRHGLVLEWHEETGQLSLAEPYVDGVIHGTALQWDHEGRFLGGYTLDQGSGFDIWRCREEDGSVSVKEVHSLRHGVPQGFQWWFGDVQRLWWEIHFVECERHGIERRWNGRGRLCRDAPRYWINGQRVNKRAYIRAAAKDSSLPVFEEAHQQPIRAFPREVQRALDARG